jgi:hypothetical protein
LGQSVQRSSKITTHGIERGGFRAPPTAWVESETSHGTKTTDLARYYQYTQNDALTTLHGGPEARCGEVAHFRDDGHGWRRIDDVAATKTGFIACASKCMDLGFGTFGLECPRSNNQVYCQCATIIGRGSGQPCTTHAKADSDCQSTPGTSCDGPGVVDGYFTGGYHRTSMYRTELDQAYIGPYDDNDPNQRFRPTSYHHSRSFRARCSIRQMSAPTSYIARFVTLFSDFSLTALPPRTLVSHPLQTRAPHTIWHGNMLELKRAVCLVHFPS